MAPKVLGTLHLHALTGGARARLLRAVLVGAGLLGSPGQANYAAASASSTRSRGRSAPPGTPSSAWTGASSRTPGCAASASRGARLAAHGAYGMTTAQGMALLPRPLSARDAQIGVIPLDTHSVAGSARRRAPSTSLLARLLAEQPSERDAGARAGASGRRPRRAAPAAAAPRRRPPSGPRWPRRACGRSVARPAYAGQQAARAHAAHQPGPGLAHGASSCAHRLQRSLRVNVPVAKLLAGMTIDNLVAVVLDSARRWRRTGRVPRRRPGRTPGWTPSYERAPISSTGS